MWQGDRCWPRRGIQGRWGAGSLICRERESFGKKKEKAALVAKMKKNGRELVGEIQNHENARGVLFRLDSR